MVVEAELCAASCEAMQRLRFDDFTLRLNHRQVLAGVLDAAGVAAGRHADALVALDKLDKIGRGGVAKEFEGRGIAPQAGEKLLDFFAKLAELERASQLVDVDGAGAAETQFEAFNRAALGRLVEFVGAHEAGARGVEELRKILDYSWATPANARVKLDPSLARGLSYYTGAIMELSVPDLAGSLGGGGRYDNLVGMFSGRDVPACGFSLGLERIIVVMTEREMFPPGLVTGAPSDVLVTLMGEELTGDALRLAAGLRAQGLRVDVYPEADKLAKQFKYASARGVPFVAVAGEAERGRGEVALKDMRTGEQLTLGASEVAAAVRERLGGRAR